MFHNYHIKMEKQKYVSVTVCNEDGHPFKDIYVFENEQDVAQFESDYTERNGVPFGYDSDVWNQSEIMIVSDREKWLTANCYRGFMNDIWVLNND